MGGKHPSEEQRLIYSLPARMGGLGFLNPTTEAKSDYECSVKMTSQLAEAIYNQSDSFSPDPDLQALVRKEVSELKEGKKKALLDSIKNSSSEAMLRLLELAAEKGASSWLTSLPLADYGFRLNKQQFVDALCMRYDLPLDDAPRNCACGEPYSVNHCLTCRNGGYVIMRHNTVRDTTQSLLNEVCRDVQLEPALLPVTGEQLPPGAISTDGARADVSALGFWQPMSRAFFYVKVVNPLATTNWSMKVQAMYKTHENTKKRSYNARILQIEKGSFTPLIFSCSGGMGMEASSFIKELAVKVSAKRGEMYSQTVSFIRRRYRFDLLKTCIISLRGERKATKAAREIAELDIGLCNLSDSY